MESYVAVVCNNLTKNRWRQEGHAVCK